MDEAKIKQLAERGWHTGEAADFLHLAPDEIEFIGLKMDLARTLRSLRQSKDLTRARFAHEIGSTPSRVDKMETADPAATLDEIILAMLKAGARRPDIAQVIAP